jgi:hypothetical protein
MQLSAKPMANPAVIWREVQGGEAVLVNTDTSASIVLNATGNAVWKWMDGDHSLEDLVAIMKRQFEDVPDAVFDHITALVGTLAEEGFVGYELLEPEL